MYRTKTVALFILTSILLTSCKEQNKISEEVYIPINQKEENNPVSKALKPFRFLDSIPSKFRGIKNGDSAYIGSLSLIRTSLLKNMLKAGYLTQENYSNLENKIYCLSGIKNGKQYVVLDANRNYDFSDDKEIIFDKSLIKRLAKNGDLIDSLPTTIVKGKKLYKNKIYIDNYHVAVYPNPSYFGGTGKSSLEGEALLKKELTTIAKFSDYGLGEFQVDKNTYKVALGKYGPRGLEFLFSQKEDSFYSYKDSRREIYLYKDTINLEQHYFRIDSLTSDLSALFLKRIEINSNITGFRTGNIIQNYQVESLEGKQHSLEELFGNNEFLLLDFWGTWCGPCKELTPDLVKLNNNNKNKVSMVSLAFDKDSQEVINYVSENNMDWFNGIIKGNAKSRGEKPLIIEGLRINAYPTFVLINKDMEIIYRGIGNKIKEINDVLNSK